MKGKNISRGRKKICWGGKQEGKLKIKIGKEESEWRERERIQEKENRAGKRGVNEGKEKQLRERKTELGKEKKA